MTKLLGVLGDPVGHSLSPVIHNHWLREASIPATYEALQVPEGEFDEALTALAARDTVGFNVTLPHKIAAFHACTTLSPDARAVGAVNTLTKRPDGTWDGHNTDVSGFLAALKLQGIEITPQMRTLVIGAGGAARAVVHALASRDNLPLIVNRSEDKARQVSIDLTRSESAYGGIEHTYASAQLADLVINTVSLGHSGQCLSLPPGEGKPFVDISYGAAAAGQLQEARDKGWQALDGLPMLVAQAADSFERWFAIRPDTDYILKHCRKLVEVLT